MLEQHKSKTKQVKYHKRVRAIGVECPTIPIGLALLTIWYLALQLPMSVEALSDVLRTAHEVRLATEQTTSPKLDSNFQAAVLRLMAMGGIVFVDLLAALLQLSGQVV